ncbi:MAG: ATP-dependent DNA helicase RecG [Lachnospiraceae bacterium]|nr:ATP-dependent DNA helicase RecG [Lachnospiraceae bacterium]
MDRSTSVGKLKGIGEKTEKLLGKLDIHTIDDLIHYYPREYEAFGPLQDISDIKPGEICAIDITVAKSAEVKKVRSLTIVNAYVTDASGMLKVTWYNMPFLKNTIKHGYKMVLRGRVVKNRYETVMEHPVIYKRDDYMALCGARQPVYALTAGLSNKVLSKAVKQALSEIKDIKDYIPAGIRKENELAELNYALRTIHFPKDEQELIFARKRLVFDEFFLFVLGIRLLKEKSSEKKNVYDISRASLSDRLIEALPYELTNAQKKVWSEIKNDLLGSRMMNRLVQGDVGSGKTVLAVLALLTVVENGYQGALMAPTEVLAKQHYESLLQMLKGCGIMLEQGYGRKRPVNIVLLTGSMTAKEKKCAYALIENHEADIIIGTHALIQEKVVYDNLALVITDEQHRFGVRQRELLSKKAVNEDYFGAEDELQEPVYEDEKQQWIKEARALLNIETGGKSAKSVTESVSEPHILVMSATPIPRTLALIIYGDMDISVVDELPAQRLPIKNCVVDTSYRPTAYKFIEAEVRKGRQVYVICPLVEESEMLDAENVLDYTEKLKAQLSPDIRIAYLHGRMKAKEKDEIMECFADGGINVLVSTTVIEVGINVPNATVMMVENAERFGLAQLHQLRGRVGRGKHQSYCIFINGSGSDDKNKRLEILNKSNDGFYIAAEDLKLRGPGDMFGIRQSGMLDFSIGDIYTDAEILKTAAKAAEMVLKEDHGFEREENTELGRKVESEMLKRISRLYL